jgi:predicted HTH transcriptional regulator
MTKSHTRFVITEEHKKKVFQFIAKNGYITNRQCRDLLDLGYDQVIYLFKTMVDSNELVRIGKTANTKYIIPKQS